MFRFSLKILCWIMASFQYLQAQPPNDHFFLHGRIESIDNRYIYLSYYDDHSQSGRLDSVFITNGSFTFSGKLNQPAVAFIKLYRREAIGLNATDIFLEPTEMNIHLTLNEFAKAHLSGSKTQNDYDNLRSKESEIIQNHPQLFDSNGYLRRNLNDFLSKESTSVLDSLNRIHYDYFAQHPTSYLTAYLLQYQVRNLSPDSLAMFYNRLGNHLQRHPVTQTVRSRLKNMTAGSVGTIASKFVAKDTAGNNFYSGLIRGKYILLDFWASWCVPCRENSFYLTELYKNYRDSGLRIISIADDRDLVKWKDAIVKDKTGIWTHVRREPNISLKMKGLNDKDDINEKFGVSTLPTYILIDSYGVIIGRFEGNNESLNDLSQTLKSVFSGNKILWK